MIKLLKYLFSKKTQEETQPKSTNTIDQAIDRCEKIIKSHSNQAGTLIAIITSISILFLIILSFPIITPSNDNRFIMISGSGTDNPYIDKLNFIKSINYNQYDSLITKAVSFQKLLNTRNEQNISFIKSTNGRQKLNLGDYILYAIFILVFGVLTSLYRFHLKEISRQEHYLIGFQRIRIAGQNSTTKYDNEVNKSLTKDAFYFESGTKTKNQKYIQSPLQGHPSSDIATDILNKIIDKFDLIPKTEKQV
jgi:hypothetical protein